MNRKIVAAIAVILLLFSAAYVGSPYWAASQLRSAATSGDVDRLDRATDFASVRQSLKSQLTVTLTEKIKNDPKMKGNPFAGLGIMMIPSLVDKMVEGFVTPEGMSAMIKRGRVQQATSTAEPATPPQYEYDYRLLDRFAVKMRAPGSKGDDLPALVFDRRGLFGWKLIRLEIPPSAFDRPSA